MGIEYVIARGCPLKAVLQDRFLPLVRKQRRYKFFLDKFAGKTDFAETTIFEDVYLGSQGIVREATSLAMMQLELGELFIQQANCQQCGVNLDQTVGGCWGYLEFPISEVVEKLLLMTVEAILKTDTQASRELLGELADNSLGENQMVTQWRFHGLTELARPLVCKWGPLWKRKTMSTDQILSYLFGSDPDQPRLNQIAKFLAFFSTCAHAGMQAAKKKNTKVEVYEHQINYQLQPIFKFSSACQSAVELGESIKIIVQQ